jgi:hypothetical protein
MRWAIVVAVWSTSLARADDAPRPSDDAPRPSDDAPSAGALTVRAHGEDDEPALHLDPLLARPVAETLLATVQRDEAAFELGATNRAVLSAEHWKDSTSNARGVTAGLHLSHDFGFARLVVGGSMSQIDSRFETGTAVHVGIALVAMRRLSRWTTAWLSLGLNYQAWLDRPDAPTTKSFMLSLGATFR